MSEKEQAIRAQIAKYEAARKVTQARNGYRHYSDKINALHFELNLLKAQEAREAAPRPIISCPWCNVRLAVAWVECWSCGEALPAPDVR